MAFNPTRLGIARKRRMLNKKGLADALDVAQHTVVRWEKGDHEPSPEIVEQLADTLGFPVAFFSGADLDEPMTASFRSLTSMSAGIRDAALSAGAIGFSLSDWIEARFNLPAVNVPSLGVYDPELAARVLREEWTLGEKPISNIVHLLESKGVRVFSLAANTAKVNAFSLWRASKPYVFLNTFKSAESSRFDAAHELGHLVLHQDGEAVGRKAEDDANKFASAFLMPAADVKAVAPRATYLAQLVDAKRRWKVSLAALCYRLHKLGLLSDWKYRDFCIEMATRGFNKSEPRPMERERSVVWEKVLRSLWKDRIPLSRVAAELSVPESEVQSLIFGVAAEAVEKAGPAGLRVVAGG